MLTFKEWMVNVITNDPAMQSLLNVIGSSDVPFYPEGADVTPEKFPAITYNEIADMVMSRPQGMHVGLMQVSIWSINSEYEVEQISERIDQLFNFKDSTTETYTGTLWWVRLQAARDMSDSARRIWHKQCDYKWWSNKTDNT